MPNTHAIRFYSQQQQRTMLLQSWTADEFICVYTLSYMHTKIHIYAHTHTYLYKHQNMKIFTTLATNTATISNVSNGAWVCVRVCEWASEYTMVREVRLWHYYSCCSCCTCSSCCRAFLRLFSYASSLLKSLLLLLVWWRNNNSNNTIKTNSFYYYTHLSVVVRRSTSSPFSSSY